MGSNWSKTSKVIEDGKEVTRLVNEEEAKDRNAVPSSTLPSIGMVMNESMHGQAIAPILFSGDNNNLSFNHQASPSSVQINLRPDTCIEFNTHECVPTFTGREEFIKRLHENIWNCQPIRNPTVLSKLVVICGMAGVGKTQVTRKYIQTYKYLYDHVVWINAEKASEAISCFLRLAAKISIATYQVDGKQKLEEDILDEVYDFICRKNTLIVYDNVGSYNTEDGKDGLKQFLPRTVKNGWNIPSIIVTTRNRNWLHFTVQVLEGFDLNIGLSFLLKLQFQHGEENKELLKELVKFCQGLPLVLQQAVFYIRIKSETREALREMYTLRDFLNEVNSDSGKFISTNPPDLEHPNVYKVFDMTFADIATMNYGTNALQVLDIMTILNPDFIPTPLLKYIFRNYEQELAEGLNLLHKYNLVNRCENYYQMHRIVQTTKIESNKNKCELLSEEEKNRTTLGKVKLISKSRIVTLTFKEIVNSLCEYVKVTPISSPNVHELLNNVIRIHDEIIETESAEIMEFQNVLAFKLKDVGNYSIAIKMFEIIIEKRTKLQGSSNTETINARHFLAVLLCDQGKYDDAQQLYNEVLEMQIKILGPDHPETIRTKHNIALVFHNQGKYDDAQKLYNEVLQMQIKILGPDHPDTIRTKHSIALVFHNQGKYDDAQKLYNEVLVMQIRILGPDHPDTIRTKHSIASVFYNQRKYDDAQKLYNEVLEIRIKILGPDHPDTVLTKHNLSNCLNQLQYNS